MAAMERILYACASAISAKGQYSPRDLTLVIINPFVDSRTRFAVSLYLTVNVFRYDFIIAVDVGDCRLKFNKHGKD